MNAYGMMARVLIGSLVTLASLYLAAYLPVLNPAIGCTWPACHRVYNTVLLYFVAFCLRIIRLMLLLISSLFSLPQSPLKSIGESY